MLTFYLYLFSALFFQTLEFFFMEVGDDGEALLSVKHKIPFPDKMKTVLTKHLVAFSNQQFGPKPNQSQKSALADATIELFPHLEYTQSEMNGIVRHMT